MEKIHKHNESTLNKLPLDMQVNDRKTKFYLRNETSVMNIYIFLNKRNMHWNQ